MKRFYVDIHLDLDASRFGHVEFMINEMLEFISTQHPGNDVELDCYAIYPAEGENDE